MSLYLAQMAGCVTISICYHILENTSEQEPFLWHELLLRPDTQPLGLLVLFSHLHVKPFIFFDTAITT